MPVVKVDMWKGKTEEQKEKLIEGITKAFVKIGIEAEWVTVILNEVPKNNWGMSGKQASKLEHQ